MKPCVTLVTTTLVMTGGVGLIVMTDAAGAGMLPPLYASADGVIVMVPAEVPVAILVVPFVNTAVVLPAAIVKLTCREPLAAPLWTNWTWGSSTPAAGANVIASAPVSGNGNGPLSDTVNRACWLAVVGRPVSVSVGIGTIVSARFAVATALAVRADESVTVTAMVCEPLEVGVPLSVPVFESVRPAGKPVAVQR